MYQGVFWTVADMFEAAYDSKLVLLTHEVNGLCVLQHVYNLPS